MKSGKSTLAEALQKALFTDNTLDHNIFNYPLIWSFAGPIREALDVIGITKQKYPELYRRGAQYIGTDLVRELYPNWWVDLMREHVNVLHPDTHVIIDDMRFENEYDYCLDAGFLLVRLDVSRGTQLARGAEESRLDHASETGLDQKRIEDWDIWLPEQTSVEERVQMILHTLTEWNFPTGSVPVKA